LSPQKELRVFAIRHTAISADPNSPNFPSIRVSFSADAVYAFGAGGQILTALLGPLGA